MAVTRPAALSVRGAPRRGLTLIARFLRACNRAPLRGKTRLTLLLAGWLKQLQSVPIEIAGMTVYMDLRILSSHFWLMGTPFERSPYETTEQEIVRRLLILGDIAFDIGANLGIHTVLLAQLVGPDGRVFAFEPNPEMLLTLALTIEALTNTNLCLFALSDENSDATLFVPADHSMASLKDWTSDVALAGFRMRLGLGDVQTFTVPQRSIDHLVMTEALPMPDFIKCDAEGAELKIFRGARETLDRIEAPTILFEAGPDTARGFGQKLTDAAEFLSVLPRAGYRFFELNEGGALTPVRPRDFREQNQNVLAVPAARLDHVAVRCTIRE
jgi:FkbM family methyltransferase